MNRVFKVIWNRTKGCYVVVAETAKNMTKRSSLSVVFSKMVGATAVAVMLTGVMMPTDALGAPITRGNGAQAENDGVLLSVIIRHLRVTIVFQSVLTHL